MTAAGTQTSDCSKAHAGEVLDNIASFVKQSTFGKICITAVARQLDHQNLKEVHKVFAAMDKDNNGVLSEKEVVDGLSQLMGEGAEKAQLVEMFKALDMDGGGTIDYTEFCAAGLCHKTSKQDDLLWAAFKTFDVDNTGFISKDNLKVLLDGLDMKDEFSEEVCAEVGSEIIAHFDFNTDGQICFADFKKMMKTTWEKKSGTANAGGVRAYDLLSKVGEA